MDREQVIERWDDLVDQLTKREALVIRLRYGLTEDRTPRTQEAIGAFFKVSRQTIGKIEKQATGKLASGLERLVASSDNPALTHYLESVIGQVRALEPALIDHLRCHGDDISELPWHVVEHLVGEVLASQGFTDVRLVGRDNATGADVFALGGLERVGVPHRLYVEVKRTRKRVGVQTLNEVYGAMISERDTHGWTSGLIVSVSGFQDGRRFDRAQWSFKGIEVRDRSALVSWLSDYKPHPTGLWLPDPQRRMPK